MSTRATGQRNGESWPGEVEPVAFTDLTPRRPKRLLPSGKVDELVGGTDSDSGECCLKPQVGSRPTPWTTRL